MGIYFVALAYTVLILGLVGFLLSLTAWLLFAVLRTLARARELQRPRL